MDWTRRDWLWRRDAMWRFARFVVETAGEDRYFAVGSSLYALLLTEGLTASPEDWRRGSWNGFDVRLWDPGGSREVGLWTATVWDAARPSRPLSAITTAVR